jgi:hypothetical protein
MRKLYKLNAQAILKNINTIISMCAPCNLKQLYAERLDILEILIVTRRTGIKLSKSGKSKEFNVSFSHDEFSEFQDLDISQIRTHLWDKAMTEINDEKYWHEIDWLFFGE